MSLKQFKSHRTLFSLSLLLGIHCGVPGALFAQESCSSSTDPTDSPEFSLPAHLFLRCEPRNATEVSSLVRYLENRSLSELKHWEHLCVNNGVYRHIRAILRRRFLRDPALHDDLVRQVRDSGALCQMLEFARARGHRLEDSVIVSREVSSDFFHAHLHYARGTHRLATIVGHTMEHGGGRRRANPERFQTPERTNIFTRFRDGRWATEYVRGNEPPPNGFSPDDAPELFPELEANPVTSLNFRVVPRSTWGRCSNPVALITDVSGPTSSTGRRIPLYETEEHFAPLFPHRHEPEFRDRPILVETLNSEEERANAAVEEYLQCDGLQICFYLRP